MLPTEASLAVVDVDDDADDKRSESNLGCFLGGGVVSEASLSTDDLRFDPYKCIIQPMKPHHDNSNN